MTEVNDRIVETSDRRRSIARTFATLCLEGVLQFTEAVECMNEVATQYAFENDLLGPDMSDCGLYVRDAIQHVRKKEFKELSEIFGTNADIA